MSILDEEYWNEFDAELADRVYKRQDEESAWTDIVRECLFGGESVSDCLDCGSKSDEPGNCPVDRRYFRGAAAA